MIADFIDSFGHSFTELYLKQVIYPFKRIYLYWHQKKLFEDTYYTEICQIQVEENQINISFLRMKLWCGKNQENVVP